MDAPDPFKSVEFHFGYNERCLDRLDVLRSEFHVEGETGSVRVERTVDHVELVEILEAVADRGFNAQNLLADGVQ